MSDSARRGRRAERWAATWLRLKGYRVLARGFAIGRGRGAGQVDLVVRRGAVVAFVEVKARASLEAAQAAITASQRERYRRAARAFLAGRHDLTGCAVRFDAVLVVPGRLPRHISDAWRMEA